MTALEIFGWLCAVSSAAISLPQLVRLIKARTSAGLSLLLWQLTVSVASAWTFHGFRTNALNLIVANALMALGALGVLVLIAKGRKLSPVKAFALPIGLVLVMCGLEVYAIVAFSILLSICQLVGAFAQMFDLIRSHDITGVSVGYLVLGLVANSLWLAWALWVEDFSVVTAASSLGAVTLLNLVLWFLRTRGLLKARGRTPEDAESEGGLLESEVGA